MIPHELTLSNFLSYREAAALDLRGIQLACIAGLNGAGKSSILDGITWALFGKCRVASDDNLIHRSAPAGATAEVTFVFELEGAIYRVIRRKAVNKTTTLELHVRGDARDGEGEARWRALTESKIRETQAAIEALLRMNYDLFTNASFFLQGKVDEFASTGATRRKEILAEVLGVSRWDDYKVRAADRRKEAERDVAGVEGQLVDIQLELDQEPERRRALESAEAQEAALAAQVTTQDALVQTLRQNQTLIDQQRQIRARIEADLAATESELHRSESAAAERRVELDKYRAVLARQAAIEAAFASWTSADAEFALWQERAAQHYVLSQEMKPLEVAIAAEASRLQQQQRVLESQAERAEAAATEYTTLTARLAGERARLAELAGDAARLPDLEEALRKAREARQQADYQRKLWAQQRDQLRALADEASRWEQEQTLLAASVVEDRAALRRAQDALAVIDSQRQQLAELRGEQSQLPTEQERLRNEMNERREAIDQLQAEQGGDCPLCGQELTEEHRAQVISQFQAEGERLGTQYRLNKGHLDELGAQIIALESAIKQQPVLDKERELKQSAVNRAESRLETLAGSLAAWNGGEQRAALVDVETLLADEAPADEQETRIDDLQRQVEESRERSREHQALQLQLSRDEARCAELARLSEQWAREGEPALDEVRRQLAEETFAQLERTALAEVVARQAAVAYDAKADAAARARREQWTAAPGEYQTLRQAEAAVRPLTDSLAELMHQRDSMAARVADLRTQRADVLNLLASLEAGGGDLRTAEQDLTRLRGEVSQAIRATGAARQRVSVLDDLRRDSERLQTNRTELSTRVARLKDLELACGTKGVQALLIDLALPEIEDHANELLNRLTGGEMRISFATQRKRKSGDDQLETLDIKIADGNGERPYENFSGGEQFRVNFAIRLALSQVLARRAGARLRTLVIDEGFGSQDPEGRQRLVEAINAVQSDFACILVITHIDELRDKFPARIDVEKTPTGSKITVVAI